MERDCQVRNILIPCDSLTTCCTAQVDMRRYSRENLIFLPGYETSHLMAYAKPLSKCKRELVGGSDA